MALRPVSELGLVDLTDLAPRTGGATPSAPAKRARQSETPSTNPKRSRRSATGPKHPEQTGRSATPSQGARRPHRSPTGPKQAKRPATTPRRSAVNQPSDEAKDSLAAKIGISVLTGAVGVAGVLVGRNAFTR
jgi:hypothetical protein